jgi:hypothetical protein
MENKDRKILVLDIDGTLVNSEKVITPKTKEALLEFQREGHIVALASGRPYPGMKAYANELELGSHGGYALSFNGGMVIDCKTEETIYSKCVNRSYAGMLYDFAISHNLGMVTYQGDKVITGTRIDDYMEYEARLNYMELKQVENFKDYVSFDMVKCLFTASVDVAEECEKELAVLVGDKLNVFRSEPYFIEVTNNQVDKAASLDNLINQTGILWDNTVCCGDGFNDVSMVKYAKLGVAMENAQQVVKDNADFITGSCDEDGLVTVIERILGDAR